MHYYHFYQQYKDHFETSGVTGMNCTPFTASFLRSTISLRWAQYKRRYQSVTLITWSEFKTFFRKDLGNFQAFIDNIWSKFRRDSQYQLEEARDQVSYLQHLQSILAEFDSIGAPNELTIIRYFWKGLKPFIKIKMEQQDQASTSFEEMVQRAVNAEAKVGLRSSTMVWDSDTCYPKGHRPSHNSSSKVQTQGSKDSSRPKKTKPKDPKSALSRDNAAESPRKGNKKDKKKRFRSQKQEHTKERKEQTPATNVNTTDVSKKKKKRRDVSEIMCFNCDKKGHFASNYTKPKNQRQSQQLPCR